MRVDTRKWSGLDTYLDSKVVAVLSVARVAEVDGLVPTRLVGFADFDVPPIFLSKFQSLFLRVKCKAL